MAKNTFLDWDTTAANNTDVGGIGILGTNAVNNFDDALRTIMAQLRAGVDGEVAYASKSGNYTALATDNNAVHRYTAAATVTLTAAATLGANWHYTATADGGAVTIDPNGSETINGLTTMIVPDGSSATIICDGSNFFTVVKPSGWRILERRTFSGVTAVDFTNLYGDIRLSGFIDLAGSASDMFWRSSTNNGSTYDSGASDYTIQAMAASNTSVSAVRTTASSATWAGFGFAAGSFEMFINNFGKTSVPAGYSSVSAAGTGGPSTSTVQQLATFRNSTTARNAIRIGTASAINMTGYIVVEART